MNKFATTLLAALFALSGCNVISDMVHDDQVVAKAGGHKLYRSQLARYIPDDASREDSTRLAEQYINSWASEILFVRTAEQQLSKSEKDLSAELEEYRHSLLRYRYEQRYIQDRLDTAITQAQINEYYEAHREIYNLSRPILKLRFIDIMKDSQNREEIMGKLPATGGRELKDLDSLAYISSLRYMDKSQEWTDAAVLAREFGTDWETMLTHLKDNYIIFESEERGDVRAGYVFGIIRSGPAPVEFCAPSIRDNILSARKRDLLASLEQDLLTEAEKNKDFVKYSE